MVRHVPARAVQSQTTARCMGLTRSRFERVASGEAGIVRDTQVVNQVPCQRHVRVVLVVETGTNRSARLLSPDIDLAAARLYGDDNARVQIDIPVP